MEAWPGPPPIAKLPSSEKWLLKPHALSLTPLKCPPPSEPPWLRLAVGFEGGNDPWRNGIVLNSATGAAWPRSTAVLCDFLGASCLLNPTKLTEAMETAHFNRAGDVPYPRAPQSRHRRPGTRKLLKKEKRKSWEEGLLIRKVGIKYAPPVAGVPRSGG